MLAHSQMRTLGVQVDKKEGHVGGDAENEQSPQEE